MAKPATAHQIARPVAPAQGAAHADPSERAPLPEPSFAVQSAKARAEAAQRAYLMASIAAGLNPLNDRVP